jgi:hypothetical protein
MKDSLFEQCKILPEKAGKGFLETTFEGLPKS